MSLTDAQVSAIRTSGLTDRSWSEKLRKSRSIIRRARIGATYTHVATPPDTAPRDQTGCTQAIRAGAPQRAVPRKQRRRWTWE